MAEAMTVPFTVADLAVLYREASGDPWNAILEVGTSGALDEERLRAAVKAACMRHPMARARCDTDPLRSTAPRWTIPEELDLDPMEVRVCPDEGSLARLREQLMLMRVPVDVSPPLRVFLVRRPGPDLVILVTSHVVMDGLSTVRVMLSMALAYRGAVDPPDPVEFMETRGARPAPAQVPTESTSPSPPMRFARLRWAGHVLRQVANPAARVARLSSTPGATYGSLHYRIDAARLAIISKSKPPGTSVNDVFIAALHLAIDAWNRDLGKAHGRISAGVPVSTRPVEWGTDVVGNFISTKTVLTTPAERVDLATATRSVAAQLVASREAIRSGQTPVSVPAGGGLPLPLKRALPKILSKLVGGRAQPSTELVTCGRLPEGLRFDDQPPPEAWLYPLCDAKVGMSALTLRIGEEMFVAVRYHGERFSPEAATRFADSFIAALPG
ncbi:MAG: hypothetical protein ACYDH6_14620 [Acidimicrobiales bacterium]